jgi:uncharacterized cofD-like protein
VLEGEGQIYTSSEIDKGFQSIYLEPIPEVNKRALDEIMNADLVVVGPGGLYTSLIPNLLVEGISKALRDTKAKKVFVVNLMNRKGQTTGFTLGKHLQEIKRFTGIDVFDFVVVNNKMPPRELLAMYAMEGEMVMNDLCSDSRLVEADLIEQKKQEYGKNDALASHRAFIRHDPQKLAKVLMDILHSI